MTAEIKWLENMFEEVFPKTVSHDTNLSFPSVIRNETNVNLLVCTLKEFKEDIYNEFERWVRMKELKMSEKRSYIQYLKLVVEEDQAKLYRIDTDDEVVYEEIYKEKEKIIEKNKREIKKETKILNDIITSYNMSSKFKGNIDDFADMIDATMNDFLSL